MNSNPLVSKVCYVQDDVSLLLFMRRREKSLRRFLFDCKGAVCYNRLKIFREVIT